MGVYAVVTDGIVTNAVVCDDAAFVAEQGWIDLDGVDPQPGIGWAYDGKTWTAPEQPNALLVDPQPVTVDPDVLSGLVTQTNGATTVAHLREAQLALLSALGADTIP